MSIKQFFAKIILLLSVCLIAPPLVFAEMQMPEQKQQMQMGNQQQGMMQNMMGDQKQGMMQQNMKDQCGKMIHDYLLDHPQIILEMLKKLKEQEATDQTIKIKNEIPKHLGEVFDTKNLAHGVYGSANPQILIAEFTSYMCPHCMEMSKTVDQLLKKHSDLEVIFIEWPFQGDEAVYAAKAVLAAKEQGKYYQVRQSLVNNPNFLEPKKVDQIIAKSGLDMAKFKAQFGKKELNDAIKTNFTLATELQLIQTPSFIIANQGLTKFRFLHGMVSEGELNQAINEVR
jgi:protein-disulfide isomerase